MCSCSHWSVCGVTEALLLLFVAVLVLHSIILVNTLTKELPIVRWVWHPEHPGTSNVFLTLTKKRAGVFCCLWQFIPLLKLPRKWLFCFHVLCTNCSCCVDVVLFFFFFYLVKLCCLWMLPVTPCTCSVTSVFLHFCYLLGKRGCAWNVGVGGKNGIVCVLQKLDSHAIVASQAVTFEMLQLGFRMLCFRNTFTRSPSVKEWHCFISLGTFWWGTFVVLIARSWDRLLAWQWRTTNCKLCHATGVLKTALNQYFLSFHTRWVQCGGNYSSRLKMRERRSCVKISSGVQRELMAFYVCRQRQQKPDAAFVYIISAWTCDFEQPHAKLALNGQLYRDLQVCARTLLKHVDFWQMKAQRCFFFSPFVFCLDVSALVVPDRRKKVRVVHCFFSRMNITDFLYFWFHVLFLFIIFFYIRKEQSVWFPAQIVILTSFFFFFLWILCL